LDGHRDLLNAAFNQAYTYPIAGSTSIGANRDEPHITSVFTAVN
jgi:hypothetical protein